MGMPGPDVFKKEVETQEKIVIETEEKDLDVLGAAKIVITEIHLLLNELEDLVNVIPA